MQFTTLALTALLGLASAQTTVTVVEVSTKNNSLVYQPDNIKVAAGDMVQFQFLAGNHTVTQSTFDQPCQPISNFNSNVTGFHSGFVPAAASLAQGMVATYTIQVNNTTPIWVYCAQGKHCEAGMVMVINENTTANSSRSLANFKALAAKSTTSVPGTDTTNGGTSGSTTTTGSTSSGTAVTTSDSSPLYVPKFVAALAAVAGSLFLL